MVITCLAIVAASAKLQVSYQRNAELVSIQLTFQWIQLPRHFLFLSASSSSFYLLLFDLISFDGQSDECGFEATWFFSKPNNSPTEMKQMPIVAARPLFKTFSNSIHSAEIQNKCWFMSESNEIESTVLHKSNF